MTTALQTQVTYLFSSYIHYFSPSVCQLFFLGWSVFPHGWQGRRAAGDTLSQGRQPPPLPCTSLSLTITPRLTRSPRGKLKLRGCFGWRRRCMRVMEVGGGGWVEVEGCGGGVSLRGGRVRWAALTCDSPVFSWRCSRCTWRAGSLLSHTGTAASPALHSLSRPHSLSPASLFLSLPRSLGQLLWLARSEVQIFKMAEGRNFNVILFVFTWNECLGSIRGDIICIAMAQLPVFIPARQRHRLLHRRRRRPTRMCVVSTQTAGGAA